MDEIDWKMNLIMSPIDNFYLFFRVKKRNTNEKTFYGLQKWRNVKNVLKKKTIEVMTKRLKAAAAQHKKLKKMSTEKYLESEFLLI